MSYRAVEPQPKGNAEAPQGQVWICGACGKRSRDRYGFKRISPGWDESCMLNSVLVYEQEEADV